MNLAEAKQLSFEQFAMNVRGFCQQYALINGFTSMVDIMQRELYAHYPFLFLPAFVDDPSPADVVAVQKLSMAGNFCYMHLILSDWLIDNQFSGNEAEVVLLSNHLQRKTLQILSSLFFSDSRFWEFFESYHEQFAEAILAERRNHVGSYQPYTEDELFRISTGKSSIGKTATTALAILFNKPQLIDSFSLSQDYFHMAFQFADDVKDWQKDYEAKHYSYVLSKVIESHHLEGQVNSDSRPETQLIGKMMYYSGVAEYAMARAMDYYQKALQAVSDIACPEWKRVIENKLEQCITDKDFIEATRKAQIAKLNKPLIKRPDPSFLTSVPQAGTIVVEKALDFIFEQQHSGGCWSDFLTNAGSSTDWVTGYVGHCLSKCSRADSVLIKAVSALQQDRFPTGGWGYSRTVVVDADSTAACVRFLKSMGKNASELSNDLEILKAHQKSDGGFSTYASPTQIRHVIRASQEEQLNGWCSSHLCVTAVAVQALIECGISTENLEVEKAVDFILSRQHPDGYWESYWWDGCIYGTAHSIMALTRTDKRACLEPVEKAVRWLLEVQQKDGGWNNGIEGESKPFHTALAVQALLLPYSSEVAGSIEKGIRWLLTHQLTDGSWMSYPILRVPEPDCLTPWEKTDWRHSSVGTGIIVEDHNRLFTTATVLTTLAGYSQIV